MPTKLILIRHGETDGTYQKRYCGVTDLPLNKMGIEQVENASRNLKKEKIDKVYSSDMKRTIQSANIVFKDKDIEKLSSLREMNFGIFEGLTYEEIMKKHSDSYENG